MICYRPYRCKSIAPESHVPAVSGADTPAMLKNQPTFWRLDSRREVLDWFEKNAPSLGQLYEASLRMLEDVNFRGRGYLICHAVREICNRLPGIVATLPNEGTLNYPERVQELMSSFEAAGLREDGA